MPVAGSVPVAVIDLHREPVAALVAGHPHGALGRGEDRRSGRSRDVHARMGPVLAVDRVQPGLGEARAHEALGGEDGGETLHEVPVGDETVRGLLEALGEKSRPPGERVHVVGDRERRSGEGRVEIPEGVVLRGFRARSAHPYLQHLFVDGVESRQDPVFGVTLGQGRDPPLELPDLGAQAVELGGENLVLLLEVRPLDLGGAPEAEGHGEACKEEDDAREAPDRVLHRPWRDGELPDGRLVVLDEEERPLVAGHGGSSCP